MGHYWYKVAAERKGPWTEEEDEILLRCVKEKGDQKWSSIAKHTGLGRSGKSCRTRWANHLRPDLKKGSISKEEEDLIIRLHSMHGNKWTRIAAELPGRTDNEIKNFWNTRLKKCRKQKMPIHPEILEKDQFLIDHDTNNYSPCPEPNFHSSHNNSLTTKADSTQISQSTTTPLPQTQHFQQLSSQSYFSSLHQSGPTCKSMQSLFSAPAMPPSTWPSSPNNHIPSLGQQSSMYRSTYPLVNPSINAFTTLHSPLIPPSFNVDHFRNFRMTAGRLPRPLSTPLLASTLDHFLSTSQESSHSTLELNQSTQDSLVSPLKLNSSLPVSPSSLDMTLPPVSRHSSFILKSEPTSIQLSSTAAFKHTSDTNIDQRNAKTIAGFELWDALLQEDQAKGGYKASKNEHLSGHCLTRGSLIRECLKSKELLDRILREERLYSEISKTGISLSENSRKEGLLTESLKTTESSGNSLKTETPSYKIKARKDLLSISTGRKDLFGMVNKQGILHEIPKTGNLMEESSRNEISFCDPLKRGVSVDSSSERKGVLTKRLKMDNAVSGKGLNTQDILAGNMREALMDPRLGKGLSSKGSRLSNCFKMEDSFSGQISEIEISLSKSFHEGGLLDQKLRTGVWGEGSRAEALLMESLNKEVCRLGESPRRGDLWSKILTIDDFVDKSMSQGFHSLNENSRDTLLASQDQKPAPDNSGRVFSQSTVSSLLESGGLGSESSFVKPLAEAKRNMEAEEDDVNMPDELSSLLEFFPTTFEIPKWYNTNQEISSRRPADEFDRV